MSVPGLVKSKLGTTSSIRTTASSSIAGAKRSNGASSAMSRTGTIFSGTGYGVYAQRSTTSLGLHNNYNLYYSAQTSALRHQLNDNRTPLFNNIYAPQTHQHEDKSNKFMGIMMGIGMGASLLGTILKGISDLRAADGSSPGDTVGSGTSSSGSGKLGSQGSVSSGGTDTSALDGMNSANDSVSLRSAIETAQGELSVMESKHAEIKGDYDKAKESIGDLKKNIETTEAELKEATKLKQKYESEVTKKESALSQAKSDYGKATKDLSTKQKEYAFAKEERMNAETGVATAQSSLDIATANYDSAKAAYDACPNDSPQKSALQARMQAAEQAKTQAETKLEEAKTALETAKQAEADAQNAVKTAGESVEQANDKMQSAEEDLKNAQDALVEAKENQAKNENTIKTKTQELSDQNAQLEDLNATIEEYEEGSKSIENMKKEIESQQDRLAKLVEKDKKAEADLDDKIARKNERLQNKKFGGGRLAGKIDDLIAKQDPIQRRNDITELLGKSGTETAEGILRSSIDRNGDPIFMLDNHEIDESEYQRILDEHNNKE